MHVAFSVDAVDGVAEADLGSIDALDAEADWSDRAVAIADLGGWLHAHGQARRVVVRGARVLAREADGPMGFTDLRLDAAVVLRDCRVDAALLLDHALLGRLEVDGCDLRGGVRLENTKVRGGLRITGGTRIGSVDGISIDGLNATIAGDLAIEGGAWLEGGVRLRGATVGGQLSIRDGAQIGVDPSTVWSVAADGLRVTGGLFVQDKDTRLGGGVLLFGATVGGELSITRGAQIAVDPWTGWSIVADGLRVTGGLFVQDKDTRLGGAVRLVGATVGGQLSIRDGAQIGVDPSTVWSIVADGLRVTGGLIVQGEDTRLDGGVRLVGATVGGQLAIHGGAKVAKDVDLEAANLTIFTVKSGHVGGVMDLWHARLGRLDDDPQGWKQVAGGWQLAGITIEALSGTLHNSSRWTTKQRIDWLRGDGTPSRRPFTQVAGLYRQAGHREQARRVEIAGEKATSSWFRRLWAGTTVGYGYQPWRAAFVALALIAFAWIPVAVLGEDIFTPTNADTEASCPDDFACLNRALYLTESVVPVVDFGQRDAWRFDPDTRYAAELQAGQYVLDGLGWVLALLLLGAVTGLIHKD